MAQEDWPKQTDRQTESYSLLDASVPAGLKSDFVVHSLNRDCFSVKLHGERF